MVDLYRVSNVSWVVKSPSRVETFRDVESAAEMLETLGVHDEAIDRALIELAGNGHSRANFGVNGTFIFSDDSRLDELVGTA